MNNELRKRVKKNFWIFIIFIGAGILAIFYFIRYPDFFLNKKKVGSIVVFPRQNMEINIEVADTSYQWSKGLMFRENMAQNSGMLFIFPDEAIRSFWMKNTLIPLDIIYISKNKVIVDVKENFLPCPPNQFICPTYASKGAAMYVLEVNAGVVAKNSIHIGDKVEF